MKRRCWVLLLLFCVACITGCWDRVEIEKRSFAVAAAFDKADDKTGKSRYAVTISMPSFSKSEKDSPDGVDILQAEGETVTEALRKIDKKTGKRIYLGQVKTLLFSEELTQEADLFSAAIQTLHQHNDIDQRALVLAVEGSASDILDAKPSDGTNAGVFFSEIYKYKDKSMGVTFKKDFSGLCADLRMGRRTVIPLTKLDDEDISITGAIAVKDFSKTGELNVYEIRGFLWCFADACRGAVVSTEVDGIFIPLVIKSHGVTLSFSESDDRLQCRVDVDVSGYVNEHAFTDNLITDEDMQKSLSRFYEQIIINEMNITAGKMQVELGMDGYNWCEELRKKAYPLYKKYANDWERVFIEMEIMPSVKVEIQT